MLRKFCRLMALYDWHTFSPPPFWLVCMFAAVTGMNAALTTLQVVHHKSMVSIAFALVCTLFTFGNTYTRAIERKEYFEREKIIRERVAQGEKAENTDA